MLQGRLRNRAIGHPSQMRAYGRGHKIDGGGCTHPSFLRYGRGSAGPGWPFGPSFAAAEANKPGPNPLASAFHDLTAHLREEVLHNLPRDLVFDTNDNWGHQAQIPSVQGVHLIHVQRNHGTWEKSHVVARDLPANLQLRLGEMNSLSDKRAAFIIHMTTPANVELHKQIWQNGIEVYTSKLRGPFPPVG